MEERPKQKAVEIIKRYGNTNNILLVGIGFKKGESLLTNSPGYSLYKELCKMDQNVTVYDPLVQNNYMKRDINFLSAFRLETLQEYNLIVVNLKMDLYEDSIVKSYEKMGGVVHVC
jgi:UDP-N-acetyl-D-mannosaminuronate dehydrogenase